MVFPARDARRKGSRAYTQSQRRKARSAHSAGPPVISGMFLFHGSFASYTDSNPLFATPLSATRTRCAVGAPRTRMTPDASTVARETPNACSPPLETKVSASPFDCRILVDLFHYLANHIRDTTYCLLPAPSRRTRYCTPRAARGWTIAHPSCAFRPNQCVHVMTPASASDLSPHASLRPASSQVVGVSQRPALTVDPTAAAGSNTSAPVTPNTRPNSPSRNNWKEVCLAPSPEREGFEENLADAYYNQ